MFSEMLRSASVAAQRLRVRSALNPILWLSCIASLICFGAAYLFREHAALLVFLVIVGSVPILGGCVGFFYLLFRKPELLQSEDYQLRHEALQMIQSKSGHADLVDQRNVTAVANPVVAALPATTGKAE